MLSLRIIFGDLMSFDEKLSGAFLAVTKKEIAEGNLKRHQDKLKEYTKSKDNEIKGVKVKYERFPQFKESEENEINGIKFKYAGVIEYNAKEMQALEKEIAEYNKTLDELK